MQAIELTQRFLQHVFQGEMAQALALVAPEARFISTRPTPNPHNPLHGTFVGPEGAQRFFEGFAALLEPGDFVIEAAFGDARHAALHGRLRHRHRGTGRDFASDWALISRVEGGRLVLYHFFEDTEALREAMTPA